VAKVAPKQPYFTADEVAEAIEAASGNITAAARRLGVNRETVRRYGIRYSTVRQAIATAREGVTDLAEARLIQAIDSGAPWAVTFYLRTQGRSRGYGEHVDLNHSGRIDLGSMSDAELERLERQLTAQD
jgi:transposase-like protein